MRTVAKLAALIVLAISVSSASDDPPAKRLISAESNAPGVVYVATLQNGFTIRFNHRVQRNDQSRLFLTADENSYLDISTAQIANLSEENLPPGPVEAPKPEPKLDIPHAVAAASDKHGIDADLLYSVIRAESGFNPRAVSNKGAQGLMQLMPGTASKLGVQDAFELCAEFVMRFAVMHRGRDRHEFPILQMRREQEDPTLQRARDRRKAAGK